MQIKIKKGLNIPILGAPHGSLQTLPEPKTLALDLDPFPHLRFTLLKKIGEKVQIGEPLAVDKAFPDRSFVSPAAGTLKEIVRGLKRRLLHLIIECDPKPQYFEHPPIQGDLLSHLQKCGLASHIRVYPCEQLPKKPPDAIFIKAIESAPFAPPPELELEGHEAFFQHGLTALSKLCPVHLVSHPGFPSFQNVEMHTGEGPHPIGCASVHIAAIHPIKNNHQLIWSLTVHDVIAIGVLLQEGRFYHKRVISIAGEGIPEDKRGYFRAQRGYPIQELIHGRCEDLSLRFLSGDPLMGTKVNCDEYLGFFDHTFCVLPEPKEKRRRFHFLRFGTNDYTHSGGYLKRKRPYSFTTLQHGEERPFVDGMVYDSVMPLQIPVMHLIKAILAEDYDLAVSLGLLTIAPEDFALPAFICPSKINMPEIIRQGLQHYAAQYL